MITYIIITRNNEKYCGKTNDIERRLKEHKYEIIPNWFGFKKRKDWFKIYITRGDWEKHIKKFGVNNFLLCNSNFKEYYPS